MLIDFDGVPRIVVHDVATLPRARSQAGGGSRRAVGVRGEGSGQFRAGGMTQGEVVLSQDFKTGY